MKTYIGIDNGVSGAIGIVNGVRTEWWPMPVRKELSYTKAKKWINRVNINHLKFYVEGITDEALALIERPMVNPGRFQATLSAVRCLEATLIVLEECSIPFQYVDSKQWQKDMLPSGLEGDELKAASLEIGRRMWPTIKFKPDADAMLMAEWGRRKNL